MLCEGWVIDGCHGFWFIGVVGCVSIWDMVLGYTFSAIGFWPGSFWCALRFIFRGIVSPTVSFLGSWPITLSRASFSIIFRCRPIFRSKLFLTRILPCIHLVRSTHPRLSLPRSRVRQFRWLSSRGRGPSPGRLKSILRRRTTTVRFWVT